MDDERGTREQRLPPAGGNGLPRHSARRPPPPAGANGEGSSTGTSRRAGPGPGLGSRVRGKRRKNRSWWVELPLLVIFALILALLIKTFIVQAFYIPSASMEDTLLIGDKVLVNKLVYDFRPVHRGDIVVFNGEGSWDPAPLAPAPPLQRLWDSITGLFGTAPGVHDYIKRVIGIPGDHVACCDAHGRVTVNGVALNEKSYLYPGDSPSTSSFHVTVPPGQLWVMGDHRSVSYDSRGHMGDPGGGTIPEGKVVGRAFLIVWPVSRWRVLSIPATFDQPKLAAGRTPAAAARVAAALTGPGIPVRPGAPLAPLALGFAGAVPLALLQRRLRRPAARSVIRGWRAGRARTGRAVRRRRHEPAGPGRGPGVPGRGAAGLERGAAGLGRGAAGLERGAAGPGRGAAGLERGPAGPERGGAGPGNAAGPGRR
jgi:signal peptidase I